MINGDKTISPALAPHLAIGYDSSFDDDSEGQRAKLMLVQRYAEPQRLKRLNDNALQFSDLEEAVIKVDDSRVVALEAGGRHQGKGIVLNKSREMKYTSKGFREYVRLGDKSEAVQVFVDDQGHIARVDNPYSCLDGKRHGAK